MITWWKSKGHIILFALFSVNGLNYARKLDTHHGKKCQIRCQSCGYSMGTRRICNKPMKIWHYNLHTQRWLSPQCKREVSIIPVFRFVSLIFYLPFTFGEFTSIIPILFEYDLCSPVIVPIPLWLYILSLTGQQSCHLVPCTLTKTLGAKISTGIIIKKSAASNLHFVPKHHFPSTLLPSCISHIWPCTSKSGWIRK